MLRFILAAITALTPPVAEKKSLWLDYSLAYRRHVETKQPLALFISAEWCGHCPAQADQLHSLVAAEFPATLLTKIDHKSEFVPNGFRESPLPCVIFYSRSRVTGWLVGKQTIDAVRRQLRYAQTTLD